MAEDLVGLPQMGWEQTKKEEEEEAVFFVLGTENQVPQQRKVLLSFLAPSIHVSCSYQFSCLTKPKHY